MDTKNNNIDKIQRHSQTGSNLRKFIYAFCLPVAAGVFLFSCTGIFTTSLGTWAARDKKKLIPNVSASNVFELVELAEKDPDMSLELLKKISEALLNDESLTPEQKAKLQSAALQAAVNSSGIIPALLRSTGGMINLKDDEDGGGLEIVAAALSQMKNLGEASQLLEDILFDSDDDDWESLTNTAKPSDMAMAAMLMVCAVAAEEDDPKDFLSFDPDNPNHFTANNLAFHSSNPELEEKLSDTILNILGDMNLITMWVYTVEHYYGDDEEDDEAPVFDSEKKRVLNDTEVKASDVTKLKDGYAVSRYEIHDGENPIIFYEPEELDDNGGVLKKIKNDGIVIKVYYTSEPDESGGDGDGGGE
ncbi:MAG: hypothetical protein LBH43_15340 [Treponema sp.]|jgi:hypothetical protein|nr:hypothetical protein [Treponema sp.]